VGRPDGTCVCLADAARIIDFVVWEMRSGDLPPDVREAALRTSSKRPPQFTGRPIHIAEGPLSVDGFPHDDDAPLDRRRAYPHQAGAVIRDLLARGCRYVLVQDIGV